MNFHVLRALLIILMTLVGLNDRVTAQDAISISGTVFEDINYGGGTGRNFSTAENSAINSGFQPLDTYATGTAYAIVELYSYDGSNPSNSELIAEAETDENGYYVFDLDDSGEELFPGDYLIRVVNDTIISNREARGLVEPLPVQTFRNDPDEITTEIINEVGGAHPALDDEGSGNLGAAIPTNAQSVTAITATGDVEDVDFGFNFDTIVNTNDSGQGSLRQFTFNSEELFNDNLAQDLPAAITSPLDKDGMPVTLSEYETSIFMIPDPNNDSRVTIGTGQGQINLSDSPPDGGIGSAFVIDTSNDSVPLRLFQPDTSIDGRTQTVNVPTVRNSPNLTIGSNETTGAEVIISKSFGGDLIYAQSSDLIFHSLGIISLGNSNSSVGLRITDDGGTGSQALSTDNVIMEELTVATSSCGIQGVTMTNSVIRNSVIRDSGVVGICNNIQLIEISEDNLIENNLVLRAAYYGIQILLNTNSNNIIRQNDIVGNGAARRRGETAGIRLRDAINTEIIENTIRENVGDGILINNNRSGFPLNTGNLISKNSIYNNGDLGIDLDARRSSSGNGLTDNDLGDEDSGGNQLQNFPVINNIISDGTNYTIEGSINSTPNSEFEIELYSNAVCNPSIAGTPQATDYGEGEKYHNTITVNTDDTGKATFSSIVAISDLAGESITANATDLTSNDTSEFSKCPRPNFILVKRITAINPGQSDERLFRDFVDDSTNNGSNSNWIGANSNNNTNTYTVGEINGGLVKPGDEIEYTIYFLSSGSEPAKNVLVCDLIPDNLEFVSNSFDSETPSPDGLPGAARGILWEYNGAIESLTNGNDGDSGYYFPPGVDPINILPDVVCDNSISSNTNGAVVVNLGDLSGASAPGTPANSYGFIRLRAKVK